MRIFHVVALTVLITGGQGLSAQYVDSLRDIVHDRSLPDTVRLQSLRDVIWNHYMVTDPDSAYTLSDSLYRFANRVDYKRHQGNALSMKATILFNRGDHEQARELYARAMELFRQCGSLKGQASTWLNLANISNQQGDHQGAMHAYTKAGDLYERAGFLEGRAQVLGNIGTLYVMQSDHGPAIEHFTEAIGLYQELGIAHHVATQLDNRGHAHAGRKDYTKAIADYTRSLEILDSAGAEVFQPGVLLNLGSLMMELDRPGDAESYLLRAKEISDRLDDTYSGSIVRANLAEIALDRGETRTAKALGEEALHMAEELGAVNEMIGATDILHAVYKSMGDHARALVMLERNTDYRDSLSSAENARALLRVEYEKANVERALTDSLRHETERNVAALAHAEQLGRERDRRNLLLAGAAILSVIAVAVWARMRQVAIANRAILAAQEKVLESERQREAERVRTRIATDIHDDLGSDLSKFGRLGRELAAVPKDEAPALIARMVELSGTAAAALSDIVWAADPDQDTVQGTVNRVRTLVQRMLEGTGIESGSDLAHTGADRSLGSADRHDLYMVVKEALHNAIKHARASRVRVSLRTEGVGFALEVEDDGVGYDTSTAGAGMGSRSMRARAERLGADLRVETAPGKGCKVALTGVWKPVHAPVQAAG